MIINSVKHGQIKIRSHIEGEIGICALKEDSEVLTLTREEARQLAEALNTMTYL